LQQFAQVLVEICVPKKKKKKKKKKRRRRRT
jgi:hypothetical protein